MRRCCLRRWTAVIAVLLVAIWYSGVVSGGEIQWEHLSSAKGELPVPGESTQQTAALVADLDGDGTSDFVLGFRQRPPALVWYRRVESGWKRIVIEQLFLTIEAGGAAADIDGDGDLDLVFGADAQGDQLWWWENPAPDFDENRSWTRRLIKEGGARQHHDQIFANLLGTGRPQLIFWNQRADTLYLARIPADPKGATSTWARVEIHRAGPARGGSPYVEGLSTADMDGDGRIDLLAGNGWLKSDEAGRIAFTALADYGGRIAAGRFDEAQATPQVVIAPGDGTGPLMLYQSGSHPADAAAWQGRRLIDRDVVHGHSLEVADINGDGHLDILCAEMAEWSGAREELDHPEATAWILYGDGRGGFEVTELCRGIDFHEAKVADLDGDGDLDILDKPYTWKAPRIDVWLNNGTETKPVN